MYFKDFSGQISIYSGNIQTVKPDQHMDISLFL